MTMTMTTFEDKAASPNSSGDRNYHLLIFFSKFLAFHLTPYNIIIIVMLYTIVNNYI